MDNFCVVYPLYPDEIWSGLFFGQVRFHPRHAPDINGQGPLLCSGVSHKTRRLMETIVAHGVVYCENGH